MNNVKAILWDYDGTIVDSTRKNMAVTKDVLRNFFPDIDYNVPEALSSVENYQRANYKYKNWRDLYSRCYSLNEEEIDEAGKLWTPCQLKNSMMPDMFEGLENVLNVLKDTKMGICSQNGSQVIIETLKHYGLDKCFQAVIGHDDVSAMKQKPEPEGFIKCLEKLGVEAKGGTFVYIGDHSEDVTFGKNAEKIFKEKGYESTVVCIAVRYDSASSLGSWRIKPDFVAQNPEELAEIIKNI